MDNSNADTSTLLDPRPAVLDIETLEPNRTVVHLREWLAAQAPWRRPLARAVRERIREAA